jgi:subtilisin family serine protease
MKRLLVSIAIATAFGLTSCRDSVQPVLDDSPELQEPSQALAVQVVPNQFIVVFNERVSDPPGLARRLAQRQGGDVLHTYQHALKGFAFRGSAQAAEALARNPNVAYVEPDREARLFASQDNPTWGLDRVDQRDLPLNDSYFYGNDAAGVNVYILDTGVRIGHVDFEGRAAYIPNGGANGDFVGDGHGSAEDCHGHGTHVAGTAAGEKYGLAKEAQIWAGRVVNCNGSGDVSMAIAGVDWITGEGQGQKPAVVNMSLGYGDVQSLRNAVENSIAKGFNYAVAAGNGNFVGIPVDACSESPAGAPNALTVGATDANDREASFSNYGTCVDILAPGVHIESDYYDGTEAVMSGTSMASPHVAGAVALYLKEYPGATPDQVAQGLRENGTRNTIRLHRRSRRGGTPNLFLYTGFIGSEGNLPPVASFTYSCSELSCEFDGSGSTDPDGTINSYDWNFGDESTGAGPIVSHSFASDGTYLVTLTVTDDDDATGSDDQDVTVSSGGGFNLTADGYKVKGRRYADLAWSGAGSSFVDIYRDGTVVAEGEMNDGTHTDAIPGRGGGSFVYQVCEAGTTEVCSNKVTVVF